MYTNLKLRTLLLLFISAFISAFIFSCKPEGPQPPSESGNVFILNEGNFLAGNASVDRFDPETKTLSSDVFFSQNQSPLGDVLQSMTIIGDKGYLVVNNSKKIEVVSLADFSKIRTITDFASPRYLLPVSSSEAYVSDLFGGSVSVVNLSSGIIKGSIPIPGWTEEMLMTSGKVFICNLSREYVYVVDPETDTVTDSVNVGMAQQPAARQTKPTLGFEQRRFI
ncbi:MAG: hypothetical protein R3C61_12865 [Bacteroidia bacterium]